MSAGSPLHYYRNLFLREKRLLADYGILLGVLESRLEECGNADLTEYRVREQDLVRQIEKTAHIRERFTRECGGDVSLEAGRSEPEIRVLRSGLVSRIAVTTAVIRGRMKAVAAELAEIRLPKSLSVAPSWSARPVALDIRA